MTLATTMLRLGAAIAAPGGARAKLAILMYHRVLPQPDALTGEIDAHAFDRQLAALRECFNVLPLAESVERLRRGSLPPRAVAITFDDGYADNVEVALPALQRHRLHATFFIATGFLDGGRMFNDTVIEAVRRMPGPTFDVPALDLRHIAVGTMDEKRAAIGRVLESVKYLDMQSREDVAAQIARIGGQPLPDDLMMRTDQLRALAAAGMEIGGHTVNHPILTRIDADRARQEIQANRSALESLTGKPVRLFAYPNGIPAQDYSAVHVAIVRELGFVAAVSTSWGAATRNCDEFQLPRFTPWDREPNRFVARLLHNLVARKPIVLDGVEAHA